MLEKLKQIYPNPRTALNYRNTFELLIAVILSAQCTDERVNKVTGSLFKKYNKPEDFAGLTVPELAREIKSCGLYMNKSKNIIATAKILVEKYNSTVPRSLKNLMELPGVGRKTANVMLSVAFGQPAMPVDTHVFRVSRRLGLSGGKTPEKTEHDLLQCIPRHMLRDAHHLLINHGRNTCKARKPQCLQCIIREHCDYVIPGGNG